MTDGYNDPKGAADYIQRTHEIVYNIDERFENAVLEISKLSKAVTQEKDLEITDKLFLEIYDKSVQLQIILLEQDKLEKMITDDYGSDYFSKLEK